MQFLHTAARCGEKLLQAKQACGHGEWLGWLEGNCKVKRVQATRYMRLASELPDLSNDSYTNHFDSINSAIAYLSASDEVKAQVDNSPEPVTEKQIKEWEAKQKELETSLTEYTN